MCARGAHYLFIIYYLLSIIYFAPQGHSHPRWCTCPQYLGKSQQKNSPTSPVNLYLPFISPGTLPRANKAPPGLCCRSVRKTTDTPCSRPRWRTCPQCPGKTQQKNSPTFSVRLYLGALCSGLSRALKTPHRGVFAPRYAKRGARAVLAPDGAPCTAFQ